MDLSTVTDMNQLKAMAYDQIALKEQAERNLNIINARIEQLLPKPSTAEPASSEDAETTTTTTTVVPDGFPTSEPAPTDAPANAPSA